MVDEIDRRTKNRLKSIFGLPRQTSKKDRMKLCKINGEAQRKNGTVSKIYNLSAVCGIGLLYF